MIDSNKLYSAISHFESSSRPTSASDSTLATVGDINKLLRNTATLFRTFIDELEQED